LVAEVIEHAQVALHQLTGEVVEQAIAHDGPAQLRLHFAATGDLGARFGRADVGAVESVRLAVGPKEAGARVGPRLRHGANEAALEVTVLRAGGEPGDLELFEPARIEREERAANTGVVQRDAVDEIAVRLLGRSTPHLIGTRAGRKGDDRRVVVAKGKRRQLRLVDARAEARVVAIDGVGRLGDHDRIELGWRSTQHDVDGRRLRGRDGDSGMQGWTESEPPRLDHVHSWRKQSQTVSPVDSGNITPHDRSIVARRSHDRARHRCAIVLSNVAGDCARLRAKRSGGAKEQRRRTRQRHQNHRRLPVTAHAMLTSHRPARCWGPAGRPAAQAGARRHRLG
jgi:hypothetical protein